MSNGGSHHNSQQQKDRPSAILQKLYPVAFPRKAKLEMRGCSPTGDTEQGKGRGYPDFFLISTCHFVSEPIDGESGLETSGRKAMTQ